MSYSAGRRAQMTAGAPYGRDSAGNFGRRHRNKYAGPRPRDPRVWCNAQDSAGRFCQLAAQHRTGQHVFGPGARR